METGPNIDEEVDKYLTSIFVTYEAFYGGTTKRNEDKWECDQWTVRFKGPESKVLESSFFTGLGLRKVANMPKWQEMSMGKYQLQQWHRENDKPKKPRAATVIHSLLSDATALDTSFEYWCQDFGMESDSIKALKLYQACCEIGKKVNAFFNREQRAALNKLLEDY